MIITLKHSNRWSKTLSRIQREFNNFINNVVTFNEIIYDFISIQTMNLFIHTFILRNFFAKKFSLKNNRKIIRTKILNAISFDQMQIKFHYDRKYQFFFMKINDFAFIRLYHDYKIAIIDIIDKKYNEQFVNSFKILKKIDRLVYRLNLSFHWRIYSIFNVIQLKLCFFFSKFFFRRHRTNNSNFIFVENNITTMKFFEIERFINKRQLKKRESKYLIRWKNCDFEYDIWRNFSKLDNVMKLINEYEKVIRRIIIIFDRLLIKNASILRKFFAFFSSKFSKSNVVVISFRNDILRKFFDIVVVVFSRNFFANDISQTSFNQSSNSFVLIKQKFVVVISQKFWTNAFVTISSIFIKSLIFIDSSTSLVRRFLRFFFIIINVRLTAFSIEILKRHWLQRERCSFFSIETKCYEMTFVALRIEKKFLFFSKRALMLDFDFVIYILNT